jgi:putative acetyltransferase
LGIRLIHETPKKSAALLRGEPQFRRFSVAIPILRRAVRTHFIAVIGRLFRVLYLSCSVIRLLRTDSNNADFRALVKQLDEWLAIIDGEENSFYSQHNKIDMIRNAVVAFEGATAIGCGAVKRFSDDTMEVKRMYTHPEHRKKGAAQAILSELERWSKELGYKKCILETGKRQPEAIALYKKLGYVSIPNYGQYDGMENSVCFEKQLGK